jgi:predicted phage baseplate assembly protein
MSADSTNGQPGCANACPDAQNQTPTQNVNRPGLSAVEYRVGTYASFLRSMRVEVVRHERLRNLRTGATDDPAVALLDAWAVVADVLTFYQERIANEHYLRTATEMRSLTELARLVGYERGPGVAAETHVAFTLETAPGAPQAVAIESGAKVQSVPGQDETPQTFETVEPVDARVELNAFRPWTYGPPAVGLNGLYLKGSPKNLKPGDAIVIVGKEREDDPANDNWDFRFLSRVEPVPDKDCTIVEWQEGLGSVSPEVKPAQDQPRVYVFRLRAALFGHNAPDWRSVSSEKGDGYSKLPPAEWPQFTIAYQNGVPSPCDKVVLDAAYPQVLAGSWLVLRTPQYTELYRVTSAEVTGMAQFAITGKATRVRLSGENLSARFFNKLRETVVFAASEECELADVPMTTAIDAGEKEITLDRKVDGPPVGRALLVAGTTPDGVTASERAVLADTKEDGERTRLVLKDGLAHSYRRDSTIFYGNVARATHGETVTETLGSGDATRTWQRFTLRQKPLTFTSTEDAGGAASTLEVRVDDIQWQEVPTLHGCGPADKVYTVRVNHDDTVTVRFGDGRAGARLPSGYENVKARYRKGIGPDGCVRRGQLTTLLTRPLGVRSATNPADADGGAYPAAADEVRRNAPLRMRALDRVVSLRDYEDFARAFAGVAKALAVFAWNGRRNVVLLTVAGSGGEVPPDRLQQNLWAATRDCGDPGMIAHVVPFQPVPFRIKATITIREGLRRESVLAAVRDRLSARFGFGAREFGQPVALSEVHAAVHEVDGVLGVNVLQFHRLVGGAGVAPQLSAAPAVLCPEGKVYGAELLMLEMGPDDIC